MSYDLMVLQLAEPMEPDAAAEWAGELLEAAGEDVAPVPRIAAFVSDVAAAFPPIGEAGSPWAFWPIERAGPVAAVNLCSDEAAPALAAAALRHGLAVLDPQTGTLEEP